jgi:nucleoside 2-deoxyribosyltransferase
MIRRKTLYLAGPLFTAAEQHFNSLLKHQMLYHGYDVILPQEACKGLVHSRDIKDRCLAGVREADAVVVNCDGGDADSGTCFEAGYAHALGKGLYAYRTDFRRCGDCEENVNLMVAMTARVVIKAYNHDATSWPVRHLADALHRAIK